MQFPTTKEAPGSLGNQLALTIERLAKLYDHPVFSRSFDQDDLEFMRDMADFTSRYGETIDALVPTIADAAGLVNWKTPLSVFAGYLSESLDDNVACEIRSRVDEMQDEADTREGAAYERQKKSDYRAAQGY